MDYKPRHITAIKKYPAFRDSFVFGCWKWLEGKRKDDYAEGLWRIHDKLYDLTDFIVRHPGGQYWLEATIGTDITEAFESHHFTSRPGDLVKDLYVKDATDSRNYFFTYETDGFYQTLKRRVASKLKTVDTNVARNSRIIHDVNLFALFFATVMMNRTEDNTFHLMWTLLAGQFLAWSANISHNFIHQADSWRIYTANISLVPWRDYRVSHVLSHHMYPNTYSDYEVTCFEPYYKWIPTQTKSWSYMIFAIFMTPMLYFTFFHNMWRYRGQGYIWAKDSVFKWDDLLMLALPISMIIFGPQPVTLKYLGAVYMNWAFIVVVSNFLHAVVHFNRGHHGTNLIHQNDEIKSFDFGEYQLSTTNDRREANFNLFTSLTYNGNQVLHHLFPTLDAAVLPELKETLLKTCKEFDVDLHPETSMLKATVEQFKQLFRSESIKCS